MKKILASCLSVLLLASSVWAGSRTFGGGATDAVIVTNYAAINGVTTFTLAAWTYRTGLGGNSQGRIMQKGTGIGVPYTMRGDITTYNFVADRWSPGGSWTVPAPSDSVWHQQTITYDYGSTTNDPNWYIDGVLQTETEVVAPSGTIQADTNLDLTIGNISGIRNWAGNLAHIAVWNVLLTAAEATQLAGGVSPLRIRPASLVLYLPLDGKTSPEVNWAPGAAASTGTVTGTVANYIGPLVRPPQAVQPMVLP